MTSTRPKPCPCCKGYLTEEDTELGPLPLTWETCDDCGYTRAVGPRGGK